MLIQYHPISSYVTSFCYIDDAHGIDMYIGSSDIVHYDHDSLLDVLIEIPKVSEILCSIGGGGTG
jgi:hypothetical protein